MDAGLAKCCPDATDLSHATYRNFRRRATVFQRLCARRGASVVSEGAYLLLQSLQGDAWDACDEISFERMGTAEAFEEIFEKLDVLYRYTQEVELPGRCDGFFREFARQPKETLNAYVLRHGKGLTKLREAGLELPDLLAGWHMMTRAAIPQWQVGNHKALCNNRLTVQVVTESLKTMFGGDSVAHKKDLENAYEATEEAYAAYAEARAKMNELAKSRGFYPAVALIDEKRGVQKGKQKGRYGGRVPFGGGKGGKHFDGSPKTTHAGSTQQRGPRFKRRRDGAPTKGDEDAKMLHEIGTDNKFTEIAPSMETAHGLPLEEVNLATGKGVGDSGATKPVMGLDEWPKWRKKLTDMGMADQITTERCQKTFRFGNDVTATAKQMVTFPVWVRKTKREITVHLAMYLDEVPQTWSDIETNEKGHMILDLLSSPEDALEIKEESSSTDADTDGDHEVKSEEEIDFYVTSTHGEEQEDAETTNFDAEQLKDWFTKVNRTLDEKPKVKRKFWDIFVNEGRISQHVEQHGDFKTDKYTLDTGWDCTRTSHREAFFEKLRRERPEEVWISPPCTLWSSINPLNDASKDNRYRQQRRREREKQKKEFLKFSRDIYNEQQKNERNAHLEHPRYATSWSEDVWQDMEGYDTFVDQCAYGLKALDRDGRRIGPIKKPTNARTTKYKMHEGLWRRCSCNEKHVMLEGAHNMRGVENYPRSMAFQAAICIVDDPQNESSYAVEEMTQEEFDKIEYKEVCKNLLEKFTLDGVKWVEKVHVQMGINGAIDIDTFHVNHVKWNEKHKLILTIMDESSRYEVDTVVPDEKAKTEIKVIEKNWINWAGVCQCVFVLIKVVRMLRREQIAKYHEDRPDDSLKITVRVTCDMRNRLRNVRGFTPAQRALGRQPRDLGNMADEPTTTGDLGEHDEGFYQNLGRRRDAAKAYFAANMSRAVREALAARNRPLAKEFQIGEYVYFWRCDKGENDFIKSYWMSPAMVTQVECTDDPDKLRQSVIWCVHNNTLLRTTHELLRPELPEERRQREEAGDDFGLPLSTAERLLKRLNNTTGSIKYKDCVGDALGGPEGHVDDGQPEGMGVDATGVDTDGKVEEPVEEQAHRDERTRSSEEAEPAECEVKEEQPQSAAAESRPEADLPEADGGRESHIEAPSQEKEEDAKPEAIVEKRKVDDRDELLESMNAARRLDGLKPLAKRPRITPMETEATKTDTGDDELLLLHEDEEMIYLTNAAKRDAVAEARLTPDEKANARVILQGFHLEEVTSTNVEKASPTLTRLARYLILLILCQQSWKMVAADVKSAFLQAKDIREQGVRIFSRPTRDIRRRLAKMMGLNDDEILQMLKPAFGDVRAPRQWNQTVTEAMIDIGFLQHQLDRCCFLSCRIAADGDDPFLVWSADDGQNVLDGILGLRVDDFIGGGENLECEADLTDKQAYEGTFLDRVQTLSRNEIEVKAEQYTHKVKPIGIEKVRRQYPDDLCTPKEISQLRGLNGAMQWPASQCMVQAAATVSFAQGDVSEATVGSLLEANKSLRFLKAGGDVGIRIRYVSKWEELRLGVYWDASWATRLNGESQGGYMIFAIEDDRIDDGQATFLVIINWTSKKLVRICRSSLAGEAQAAANAVGALEFAKTMLTTMLYPNMQLTGPDMLQVLGRSPCITYCKALYDAANSQAPAGGLTERRTGVEIMRVNEKMKEFGGVWRWTNTHQQMADGLTKLQVRQQFVEKLRRMTHALKYDARFTAGKKVSQQERDKNEQGLNDAAADFDEANAVDQTPDEVPAREMVRATRAGARTAQRLAALVATTAATTTKAEETCPSLDINETQWIYVTVLTMSLVVMVLVCEGKTKVVQARGAWTTNLVEATVQPERR
ncbi:unnamed protein product [Prorocentrum cordatum]|uniref:Reverse transcriptase Ty1/copia-type domain-containing protein n=1 Tax=Prorocentrum cordatum TaxID=2364126 RepID=A0ABN9T4Y2_9DINO|nr:unnamed protein product [Polarella glacialis]